MNLKKEKKKREEKAIIQNLSRCVRTITKLFLILLRNNPETTVNFVLLSGNGY